MEITDSLKDFTREVIKYLGSGYIYAKIAYIPPKKREISKKIAKKIQKTYETDLSRGKRQYRRKKDLANYSAVMYKDCLVVVLKTAGKHNDKIREFAAVNNLKVELSKHMSIVFFRNEHKRWTVRLNRSTYRAFKMQFQKAIEKGDTRAYNKLKEMWKNLPRWKGIGHQSSLLYAFLEEELYRHKRNWSNIS